MNTMRAVGMTRGPLTQGEFSMNWLLKLFAKKSRTMAIADIISEYISSMREQGTNVEWIQVNREVWCMLRREKFCNATCGETESVKYADGCNCIIDGVPVYFKPEHIGIAFVNDCEIASPLDNEF